ncbi:hypothetical protein [Bizionia myxarmorum]|uniref:DUF3667 domain-containing protein n=1 Tax=Bizionia myxarmorum TaxID=291186 RepID=A0A5D0R3W4_9FLAO|nr:hypothetical protein [Bizionia myxarmorum]TYB76162.1 hypothetical protein ES674_11195 [Bizionia myxarmorum]
MNPEKTCSICQTAVAGNYCSHCGQKYSEKKTHTLTLLVDLVTNFFSMERSGFATILKVLKNPKSIVNNYHNGFRKYHASPGQILVYGIAVVALHVAFVTDEILGIELKLDNLAVQYAFWIFLYPFFISISYISFFRVEKSFSKHLVSLIYIATSLFIAITVVNDIIISIWGDILGGYGFVLFVALIFFWNSRVFTTRKKPIFILLNALLQIAIFAGIVALIVNNIEYFSTN